MQDERMIVAVDLGTSKIALSAATVKADGSLELKYHARSASDGVRHGVVFNPQKASKCLGRAIKAAEDELGTKISRIAIGLPRYGIWQKNVPASLERTDPDKFISGEEVDTLKTMARDALIGDIDGKSTVYGVAAQSFDADDLFQVSEEDVVGVTSNKLDGNFKIFVGSQKAKSNIQAMAAECGVMAQECFLPETEAQVLLTHEEMDNGVALVEIGAGVSSLTIYQAGILRYYAAVPFGGNDITGDIKLECGFHTSLAENVKKGFGICMPDNLQNMSEKVLQIGDSRTGDSQQLPIKYLSEIITCRASEIIDALLYQIQESGYAERLRCGVVLTGGCAELANLSTLLKEKSGYCVRLGYPHTRDFNTFSTNGICELDSAASLAMLYQLADTKFDSCNGYWADAAKAEEPAEEVSEEPAEEEQVQAPDGQLFGGEYAAGDGKEKKKKTHVFGRKSKPVPENGKNTVDSPFGKITVVMKDLFNEFMEGTYDTVNEDQQQ